jgi:predicted RNA methylase
MNTPRRPFDFYETPPHYVHALLHVIGPMKGKVIYEPCVGKGHIASRLTNGGATLYTNDLDPKRKAKWHRDATLAASWGELGFDWVITNPPFMHEQAILEQALAFGKNVAFLARLSFLEPTRSRRAFWRRHRPKLEVIVLPRYSFRPNAEGKRQTDSMTCCWLIWRERGHSRVRISLSREK